MAPKAKDKQGLLERLFFGSHFKRLEDLIMATKEEALQAIADEAAEVKAKIDELKAIIAGREDVPADVVEAIKNIFTPDPVE